jgi:hypothetical protein
VCSDGAAGGRAIQLPCVTWRPVIFEECGLEWDHNLDVSARMLPKRGNNFLDACDFKRLGVRRCGQKMAFSNLRAMNLSIVVRYIMGRIILCAVNKFRERNGRYAELFGQAIEPLTELGRIVLIAPAEHLNAAELHAFSRHCRSGNAGSEIGPLRSGRQRSRSGLLLARRCLRTLPRLRGSSNSRI